MRSSHSPMAAALVLGGLVVVSLASGQEQPSKSRSSNYHFIVDFSRDQLVVTEMIARPAGQQATARSGETTGEGLRMQLPAGAVVFQVGAGVKPTAGQVVLDFAQTGEGQYLTWKYFLPMGSGTMSVERLLPLPVTLATVITQQAGVAVDVTWPEGASVAPSVVDTARYLIASARDVPAGEPLTIVLLGIPEAAEAPGMGWLLWVVGAMVVATVVALLTSPRRR